MSQAASSAIGQPKSYETQWLASDGKKKPGGRKPEEIPKKPQLSKAERRELQEKQRAEKAAKRAAAAATTPQSNANHTSKTISTAKSVTAADNSPINNTNSNNSNINNKKKKTALPQRQKSILSHLRSPGEKLDTTRDDLHPAVIRLGLVFSEYKLVGSNARCVAMLETFLQVLKDYRPPENDSFVRHIQKHLDPHIAFILDVRPISLSVRECIRWFKKLVASLVAINPPLSDEDASAKLEEEIHYFIRERITVADKLIAQHALTKINDEDVILTFSKSSLVEKVLLNAHQRGVQFSVIVVDSRPLLEGKHLLEKLVSAGIRCKYVLITSIYVALKTVTKVILGAHAILNNGCSYSRVGSALVSMAAKDRQIPVMVCAETYKFVNKTQVDSLVLNEKADENAIVRTDVGSNNSNNNNIKQPILADWKQSPTLNVLNLMYDVTPSKYISLVITEVGMIPCTSAPVIWREFNELGKSEK